MAFELRGDNMLERKALSLLAAWLVVGPLVAAELADPFDGPPLDLDVWNPCSADVDRLIGFGSSYFGRSGPREFLINKIDEEREDAECYPLEDDADTKELGPSLVDPLPRSVPEERCAVAQRGSDGKKIKQRNELRFQESSLGYGHLLGDPHWYALTFKLRGEIPTCGSVRWVTASWKYEDPDRPEGFVERPFLAQRFDNGVLHVTIQNGDCRCRVAKAAGDPGRRIPRKTLSGRAPKVEDLEEIDPLTLRCVITKKGSMSGEACPKNLHVYVPPGAGLSTLPDPQRDWVKMVYHVKGGGDGDGRVDIYANGTFVARVEGAIGYPGGSPGRVKFKFGTYRNKIRGEAQMLVDQVCVSKSAATCDPDLRPIEKRP